MQAALRATPPEAYRGLPCTPKTAPGLRAQAEFQTADPRKGADHSAASSLLGGSLPCTENIPPVGSGSRSGSCRPLYPCGPTGTTESIGCVPPVTPVTEKNVPSWCSYRPGFALARCAAPPGAPQLPASGSDRSGGSASASSRISSLLALIHGQQRDHATQAGAGASGCRGGGRQHIPHGPVGIGRHIHPPHWSSSSRSPSARAERDSSAQMPATTRTPVPVPARSTSCRSRAASPSRGCTIVGGERGISRGGGSCRSYRRDDPPSNRPSLQFGGCAAGLRAKLPSGIGDGVTKRQSPRLAQCKAVAVCLFAPPDRGTDRSPSATRRCWHEQLRRSISRVTAGGGVLDGRTHSAQALLLASAAAGTSAHGLRSPRRKAVSSSLSTPTAPTRCFCRVKAGQGRSAW